MSRFPINSRISNRYAFGTLNGAVWCDDLLVVPIFQHSWLIYRIRACAVSSSRGTPTKSLARLRRGQTKPTNVLRTTLRERKKKKSPTSSSDRRRSCGRIDSRALRSLVRPQDKQAETPKRLLIGRIDGEEMRAKRDALPLLL